MYQSGASQITKALVEANIEDYTMEFFLFNETCVPYHVIIVKLNFGTEFPNSFLTFDEQNNFSKPLNRPFARWRLFYYFDQNSVRFSFHI